MTEVPLLVRFARFYATTKHGDQKYGSLPYTHHLAAVEAVVVRFWDDPSFGAREYDGPGGPEMRTAGHCWILLDEMRVAAWLHDVVEDVPGVKLKDIEEDFGPQVARLVGAVTNEPGPNRKVRAALTYPKIRATPGATYLKLCDRIANVENGGSLVQMYRDSHEDFRRSLHVQGEYGPVWEHLDELLAKE